MDNNETLVVSSPSVVIAEEEPEFDVETTPNTPNTPSVLPENGQVNVEFRIDQKTRTPSSNGDVASNEKQQSNNLDEVLPIKDETCAAQVKEETQEVKINEDKGDKEQDASKVESISRDTEQVDANNESNHHENGDTEEKEEDDEEVDEPLSDDDDEEEEEEDDAGVFG